MIRPSTASWFYDSDQDNQPSPSRVFDDTMSWALRSLAEYIPAAASVTIPVTAGVLAFTGRGVSMNFTLNMPDEL